MTPAQFDALGFFNKPLREWTEEDHEFGLAVLQQELASRVCGGLTSWPHDDA